jgi:hypothetical protein
MFCRLPAEESECGSDTWEHVPTDDKHHEIFSEDFMHGWPIHACSLLWKPRFTKARHWALFWATRIHSTSSHSISVRQILVLFTSLRLGLTRFLFPWDFPIKILLSIYMFILIIFLRYPSLSLQIHSRFIHSDGGKWTKLTAKLLAV